MESRFNRRAWQWPWSYRESAILVGAVLAGGFAAQWWLGPLPEDFLAWPLNLLALAVLFILAFLARRFRTFRPVRYLTSIPFSATLILALALLALVMGFVPQLTQDAVQGPGPLVRRLGFFQVTSSWPFVFLYLLTLIGLGMTVAVGFALKRRIFLLNHVGIWFILLAAGLGAADRQRELIRVPEGGVEWRSSLNGQIKELDLAIRLDDFVMQEYPARIILLDPATGKPWPSESAPALFQIDNDNPQGRLPGYEIEVLEFIPSAVPIGDGGYVKALVNGAVQAALVKATSLETGQTFEGWLSSGNGFIRQSIVRLSDSDPEKTHGLVLAMTKPEPRLFLSKVKVFTKQGDEVEADITVNHPLRAGPWLIYQRDYDTNAGPLSTWSGFDLIKDRWLYLAYVGFILWAAGCLGMIVKGRN